MNFYYEQWLMSATINMTYTYTYVPNIWSAMLCYIHFWQRVRNILSFGRKLEVWCIFTYSLKCSNLSMFVNDNRLVQFEYVEYHILINSFIANPGYWQMCVESILTRSASSPNYDEVTTDLMLTNMKNNIFPLLSTIIFPKMLILCSYLIVNACKLTVL